MKQKRNDLMKNAEHRHRRNESNLEETTVEKICFSVECINTSISANVKSIEKREKTFTSRCSVRSEMTVEY